jgi:hypothetical protein
LSSSNGASPVCSGQNITFNATGATQFQFQLNGNNIGVQSGSSSLQLNNLLNGAVVGVIGTSNLGCVHTSVLPPFVVNQTPTTTLTSTELDLALCVGTPVLFTANGASNYQFFVNSVSQGPSSPSATLTLANLQDNDLVEVVGSNQNCIDYSPSLIFNVYNYPNVTIANQGGNQICVGDAVNVIASGANNYQFLLNSVAIGPNSTNNTFNGTLNNGDTLSVIGETFGCSAAAITPISLIVYPYPVLLASCDDIDLTICLLDTVNFSGDGTYLTGLDHTSNDSLFINCKGIINTAVNGQLYMQGNATATVVSATNTFYKVLGTTTASSDNSKFSHSNNRLTCDAIISRKYLIQCFLSFTSGNNNVCEFGFYDSQLAAVRTPSKTKSTANASGRAENIGFACVLTMESGDYLEIHASNTSATTNITVDNMNFVITEIK